MNKVLIADCIGVLLVVWILAAPFIAENILKKSK
jgi:hypothetical protein